MINWDQRCYFWQGRLGDVNLKITTDGEKVFRRGISTDILEASASLCERSEQVDPYRTDSRRQAG